MDVPEDAHKLRGTIPPTYEEASQWPGAETRAVAGGTVVLHGKREMWFDYYGQYNHHTYHSIDRVNTYQWTEEEYRGRSRPVDETLNLKTDSTAARDAWDKNHGPNHGLKEISPNMYRGHTWAWAVDRIIQNQWGDFVAKMADGAEINASTFATLMDTITKNYPERMRRDEMATFTDRDYYSEPPSWVGQTTTYEKQRRAANRRKRDEFGRFLPEDEPELDYNEHAARDRERMRVTRAKRLADQMIPSHEHPDNMRNILKHMDPGPKKIRFNSGGRGQTDDQLERWTVRVSLGGKNMTDFAQELRLSKFGLYADLKAYDTQADEWDVTIRGGKDAFDRWFAEMRKEKEK